MGKETYVQATVKTVGETPPDPFYEAAECLEGAEEALFESAKALKRLPIQFNRQHYRQAESENRRAFTASVQTAFATPYSTIEEDLKAITAEFSEVNDYRISSFEGLMRGVKVAPLETRQKLMEEDLDAEVEGVDSNPATLTTVIIKDYENYLQQDSGALLSAIDSTGRCAKFRRAETIGKFTLTAGIIVASGLAAISFAKHHTDEH